jgi:DNA polymerase IV
MSTKSEYTHLYEVHKITDYNKIAIDHIRLQKTEKIYCCIDLNCFYAQVEMRDNKLEGMPIILGGWRNERNVARGIVATSNYEARAFGIKTGMSALEAMQLCPHVIMLQVDYEKYKAISKELEEIFRSYTHLYEMYSMDECFMDMTGHLQTKNDCETFINEIKKEIWDTIELTVNIGISITKTYSKILADMNKPDGHMIALDYEDIMKIIFPLPVSNIWGIAKRRSARLAAYGIQQIGQLAFCNLGLIRKIFGHNEGEIFWRMARGEEETIIIENKIKPIQTITHMHTFPVKTMDKEQIWGEISIGLERMCYRLRGFKKKASDFNLLIRPQQVQSYGKTFRIDYTYYEADLIRYYRPLFEKLYHYAEKGNIEIRGIGMSADRLKDVQIIQYDIFRSNEDRKVNLYRAIDKIKNEGKFKAIQLAASMEFVKGRTHFVDRSDY